MYCAAQFALNREWFWKEQGKKNGGGVLTRELGTKDGEVQLPREAGTTPIDIFQSLLAGVGSLGIIVLEPEVSLTVGFKVGESDGGGWCVSGNGG